MKEMSVRVLMLTAYDLQLLREVLQAYACTAATASIALSSTADQRNDADHRLQTISAMLTQLQ